MVHGKRTNNKKGSIPVRPPRQVPMYAPDAAPDPSKGGLGYGLNARRMTVALIEHAQQQGAARVVLDGAELPGVAKPRTQRRWMKQKREEGDVIPKRHTGNNRATKTITGIPLMLLAFYRVLYPKAQRCEVQAFLYSAYSGTVEPPFFYSLSAITAAENEVLGLNFKAGSTTAYQALTPANVLKRQMFWQLPAPHGIADVPSEDMIDLDEAGISLETANRKHGKARVTSRVRAAGNYGHNTKWTLVMAISGGADGERWFQFVERAGTTVYDFYFFVLEIVNELDRPRVFTMDNLTAHHNPFVVQLIFGRGHMIVFRAPYYPVDGPIEYVFNHLQCVLGNRMHEIRNYVDLNNHLRAIIRSIDDFVEYFENVGFTNLEEE